MPPSRLLLVEDDSVSAAFLAEALAGLPAIVDVAGSIAEALALARRTPHVLWLVDAHLPDGSGLDCLRALRSAGRQDAGSDHAPGSTPALALTAGATRAELDALCGGGYLEVLMKPVAIALLQGTVRRLLGAPNPERVREPCDAPTSGGKLPPWEDAAALAAIGGNTASLAKLRRMFLEELPTMQAQLAAAQADGDAPAVQALVHKLRASCGFVGAARLRAAVEGLARAPLDAPALRAFDFAAEDSRAAAPQS
jgi:CheY-like chemotaxis protein/HPt (histidine-containing phosphotransfer) domain-containing protein